MDNTFDCRQDHHDHISNDDTDYEHDEVEDDDDGT